MLNCFPHSNIVLAVIAIMLTRLSQCPAPIDGFFISASMRASRYKKAERACPFGWRSEPRLSPTYE